MKWLRYAGAFILGVVALACVVLVLYNWLTARSSAALASAARAKGQPMTVDDVNRRLPPDSRNGARIYEDAFRMVESSRLRGYAESARLGISDAERTPGRWVVIGADTDALAQVYDLLEQAAAMPECGFGLKQTRYGAESACAGPAYKCERLCRARATVAVHRGDRLEAARMLKLLLGMGHSLGYEPCWGLILQDRAVECFTHALQDVVRAGALTPEMADAMHKGLGRLDPQRSYVRSLEGERVVLCSPGTQERVTDRVGSAFLDTWSKVVAPSQMARLAQAATSHLDNARLPYRVTVGRHGVHPWEPIIMDRDGAARLEADYLASLRLERDRLSALIAGDQAYLAILLYKMKRGSYPASLADAAALAGWSLQPDPFSGKPLIYTRRGTGFALYSVGDDLNDNGGVNPRPNRRVMSGDTDIVWSETK